MGKRKGANRLKKKKKYQFDLRDESVAPLIGNECCRRVESGDVQRSRAGAQSGWKWGVAARDDGLETHAAAKSGREVISSVFVRRGGERQSASHERKAPFAFQLFIYFSPTFIDVPVCRVSFLPDNCPAAAAAAAAARKMQSCKT